METKRKIFEEEHLDKLKELTWLFISNNVLIGGGPMGAGDLDANSCINTLTASTLNTRKANIKKVLVAEGETSEWVMNEVQEERIEVLKLQAEFLYLAEGYVRHREYLESLNAAELLLILEEERLKNTGLTRTQKIKKIKKARAKVVAQKEQMAGK